jgi:hypothetical protein
MQAPSGLFDGFDREGLTAIYDKSTWENDDKT